MSATSAATAQHTFRYHSVGVACAASGVMLFSIRPILIKLSYAYVVDPITLLALRMVFAVPFFVAMAWWVGRRPGLAPIARRDWLAIGLLGFLGYYLASFLDFLGLQFVSAGLGRLILFLYPTMVVLLSWIFLRQKAGARELLALVVTYAGLATVLAGDAEPRRATLLFGAALLLGSALSYAIYLVLGAQVIRRVGAMRFAAYATIVASALCVAQFLIMRPWRALDLPSPVYGYAITMALASTVIPIFLTGEALRRIGATRVAIMGALGPVTTLILGYLGLDERLSSSQVVGALLVLAGVLAVVAGGRKG